MEDADGVELVPVDGAGVEESSLGGRLDGVHGAEKIARTFVLMQAPSGSAPE
jgi:hypothetical protein